MMPSSFIYFIYFSANDKISFYCVYFYYAIFLGISLIFWQLSKVLIQ